MNKLIMTLALLLQATFAPAGDLEITGFADAATFMNLADKNGEFSLDQFEMDIVHQIGEKASLRADIEWIRNAGGFTTQLEQGALSYTLPGAWDFTFGKFNAPIGFELLDAPDMYQYSHALVFDLGLPTNLTGASLARSFDGGFDFIGHVSNGWDANSMAGKNLSWGGRLGLGLGGFSGGLSAITGGEEMEIEGNDDPLSFTRTVIDVDLGFEMGICLFGAEYNQGWVCSTTDAGDLDQAWSGFMLMTHLDFTSRTGLTFRYDLFDDTDGWALPDVNGEFQKLQSFTFCPTLALDENLGALVELRIDKSNLEAFADKDGEPSDTRTTLAFEMTYSW